MIVSQTSLGRLVVGDQSELFAQAALLAQASHAQRRGQSFVWAMTGGSTPAAWYRWASETSSLSRELLDTTTFTVSDERYVSLTSDQSNFGNAQRQLLEPLMVNSGQWLPWAVEKDANAAVDEYTARIASISGPGRTYDLCFLGMGDDCHTASLFPGTPLLKDDAGRLFGAQEIPGKGMRLTITPSGLQTCGLIVVMTLGANKSEALHRIFRGEDDPTNVPCQILRRCADRVVWLVDAPAASRIL